VPADFIGKVTSYLQNIHQIDLYATIIGCVSILIIMFSRKITLKIPGPFIAVVFGVVVVYFSICR